MKEPTMNSHAIACVAAIGENSPALVGTMIRAMEAEVEAYSRIRAGDMNGPNWKDAMAALVRARSNLSATMRIRYESETKAKEAAPRRSVSGTGGRFTPTPRDTSRCATGEDRSCL